MSNNGGGGGDNQHLIETSSNSQKSEYLKHRSESMYEPADLVDFSQKKYGNLNSIAEKTISEEHLDFPDIPRKNS